MSTPGRDEALSGPFAAVQRDVLELIAVGAPLERVLDRLAVGVESLLGEGLVTIQVVDGPRLRNVAAPSTPAAYLASIADFPITPGLGSCLAAAAAGAPVIVEDIATSPNWQGYAQLAIDHGLHACWSTPVLTSEGQVIGTFAVYYRRPTAPPESALGIVAAATAMASIVMRHEIAQHALRVSEERFRQMAATIDEVFWLQDATTLDVLYVSPAFESIWGLPSDALYADARTLLALALADDRDAVAAALANPRLRSEVEFRIERPDGAIRWLRGKRLPVFAADGRLVRLVGVVHDVTNRKQLERQFLQAQRVESLGTLASGIAHDLNNVLTPILMAASSLRAGVPDDVRESLLRAIEDSAQRGASLVQQVLAFARGVEGEYGPVSLVDVVEDVVRLMRDTGPRGIDITTDLPDDLPAVMGDTTQLHQVLLNLVVNSRDAMPDGGCLTITAHVQAAGVRPGLASGTGAPCVCLAVSDTGSGIAEEMQHRIFDPFYTTKPMGRGSGLGLSTVMSLVRNHGGQISVDSTLGRGSTFRVTLPIAHEGPASRRSDEPLPKGDGRGALVLLVDDEPTILTVVKVGLERVGYRVITAASARAALKLLHEYGAEVVFALLDVMMPDMDGVELARVIRRRYPDVALAAATGLPSDLVLQRLRDVGIERCLTKPYELRHVLDVLQSHVPPLPPPLSGA